MTIWRSVLSPRPTRKTAASTVDPGGGRGPTVIVRDVSGCCALTESRGPIVRETFRIDCLDSLESPPGFSVPVRAAASTSATEVSTGWPWEGIVIVEARSARPALSAGGGVAGVAGAMTRTSALLVMRRHAIPTSNTVLMPRSMATPPLAAFRGGLASSSRLRPSRSLLLHRPVVPALNG